MPGRNDPCPCGSGKKYKRCCLRPSKGPGPQDDVGAKRELAAAGKELQDLLWAARHEAGHAVIACRLGIPPELVVLKSRTTSKGQLSGYGVRHLPSEDVLGKGIEAIRNIGIQIAAGPIAEQQINPDSYEVGSVGDGDRLQRIAAYALRENVDLGTNWWEIQDGELDRHEATISRFIADCVRDASRMVIENRHAIDAVADALLVNRRLTRVQVEDIIEPHPAAAQ